MKKANENKHPVRIVLRDHSKDAHKAKPVAEIHSRVDYDIQACTDPDTGEFDWDEFQHLCDIAEAWDLD